MKKMSIRHIPQRTCVACRQTREKQELIRLVRNADGSIEVDAGGKKVGRGAYLCKAWGCWEAVLKGNRLERALKTSLTDGNRDQLTRYGSGLLL